MFVYGKEESAIKINLGLLREQREDLEEQLFQLFILITIQKFHEHVRNIAEVNNK